jgi:hypothetical protein
MLPSSEFFRPPTRVSRLYPVLSLVLLLVGSGVLYRWQISQINADVTVQQRDKQIATLSQQVATLTEQQQKDQTTLASQDKELKETTSQLQAVKESLQKVSDELSSKEKSLTEAQEKLKQQESQLSSNAAELQQLRTHPPLFSFQNKSTLADIDQKEAEIKEVVTDAYDYIQDLYGSPYLLNQITITFVDEFTIAGAAGEITIENSSKGISIDIHLKDFDKNNFQDVNTIVHETIHGFHGIAVMERMIADGKIPNFKNLYIIATDAQYNLWNRTLTIPADNDAFYTSKDIAKIYQVIGYAWMGFYRQDKDFFKKLNEAYYAEIQKGNKGDDNLILDSIKKVIPSVNGIPINSYLSQNQAFNPQ